MKLGVGAALVDGRLVPGDVEIDGGVLRAVGLGNGRGPLVAAPGFVDLQVNGYGDVDLLGADAKGYAAAGAAMREHGTTAYLPTFITAPEAAVRDALRGVPSDAPGPRVLGVHLEGPFLAPARRGAHPAEHLRPPDLALLRRLLEAGPVRRVTLAPELPGALELVDELVARGIAVAAGHSAATAAQAHAAFDRGIAAVTHLHNAMAPGTPREPGLATAALARDDVAITLIADGHHLADDTVRVAWRAVAGRLALITDAAARHSLGGEPVHTEGGAVRRPDGRLAGSALTMIGAVRNLHALGAPLEAALEAASTVPARLAGRPDLGRLAPGAPADLAILDDRLEVVRTLVAGRAD